MVPKKTRVSDCQTTKQVSEKSLPLVLKSLPFLRDHLHNSHSGEDAKHLIAPLHIDIKSDEGSDQSHTATRNYSQKKPAKNFFKANRQALKEVRSCVPLPNHKSISFLLPFHHMIFYPLLSFTREKGSTRALLKKKKRKKRASSTNLSSRSSSALEVSNHASINLPHPLQLFTMKWTLFSHSLFTRMIVL